MNINKWLLYNLTAMTVVFVFGAANVSIEQYTPFFHNLLDLPTGARLGMLLLFGVVCFPGTLLGSLLNGVAFLEPGEGFAFEMIEESVEAFSALVALLMMQHFKLSNFYTSQNFYYPHVLFLCFLTAFITATARLITLVQFGEIEENFNFSSYIGSILIGDLLGTILFFSLSIFLMQALNHYFEQQSSTD